MELFKYDAELYLRKVVEMRNWHGFDLEAFRDNLKSVTSCYKMLWKSSSVILEQQESVKED